MTRLALGMVCALALAACGSRDGAPAATEGAATGGVGAAGGARAAMGGKGDQMVRAVSSAGKPGAPVEVRFEILSRPEAGRVLPIRVELTPRGTDVAALEATFQSSDGVSLVKGGQFARQDKPADGTALLHEIEVLPTRDGVFYVSAVALVETANGSIARSFAIPVIVGGGAGASAAVAAKPAEPARDGAGQPIVSMPAENAARGSATARP